MSLPNGYKRLDYIQASGTQYINTNKKCNSTYTKIVATIKTQNSLASSGGESVYGCAHSADESQYGMGLATREESSKILQFRAGLFNNQIMPTGLLNNIYNIVHYYKSSYHYVSIDGGKTFSNNSTSNFNTSIDLCLFAAKFGSSIMWYGKCAIYRFQLYLGNESTLSLDLYPAMRESDSAVGLYDLVNNQFYENAGTGAFTYGHILEDNITLTDNPLEFTLEDDLEITANFKNLGGRTHIIGV